MFYGDFAGEKHDKFVEAVKVASRCFKRVLAADNLITFDRNLTFLEDERFNEAFGENVETAQESSLTWRLHTLTWAAQQVSNLDGDYVECGVLKGFSMSVVAAYMDFAQLNKTMYLYDTFEGIPKRYNSENRSNEPYLQHGNMLKHAKERFAAYPNVKIIPGIVPDSFAHTCPEKIVFLHIDMNSSASEMAALEALYPRVIDGGIIIFDDYGWLAYREQTLAQDAFMRARGQYILELPTGQGLFIKKTN